MASSFDSAVEDLLGVCEQHSAFAAASRCVVIRDVRGRLRLVAHGLDAGGADGLAEEIRARLGPWFAGPILRNAPDAPADERRIATELSARATGWPSEWPTSWRDATGTAMQIGERWVGFQRVLSKQAWFGSTPAEPPWPLVAGNPAIVAFYSFKGGVGRTTTLAVIAHQLAALGKRVVCLDLDLEAPGLGDYLGASPTPSLLDHLLTHAATGLLPEEDPVQVVRIHGADLRVVAAGGLDRRYFEKLGRLDYLGSAGATDSPVARALVTLLQRVRGQHAPEYILLDCRAGLHDLGGLSLSDLAHVDVLVGRDTPQGRSGLALTLDVLARRRAPADRRVLVVQTFVPAPLQGEISLARQAAFRGAVYEAFETTMYAGLDDVPGETDEAGHYPVAVGDWTEVAAAGTLAAVDAPVLDFAPFVAVRVRIEALAQPEAL